MSWVDLFGVSRSKLVPRAAVAGMQKNGAGFAGFATYLNMSPADPDLFAFPDPNSMMVLPWKPELAWVACDLVMGGKLVKQAPRNVLKAQILKAKAQGWQMKTGVECEFFLLSPSANGPSDYMDKAAKPCYDQSALMRRYDVIAKICDYMQRLGWNPYQNDHEDGNGQFEMNWEYDDSLVTADRHTFFKFMVKSVAEQHGFTATFMPKPLVNTTGNGAHCHVSLWDSQGRNLFEDPTGELGLSDMAYHFIGGVLTNAKAMCAITNPTVNSYKRIDGSNTISGSSWAPQTISYTGNNRTHMLRIPEGNRFEFRLPDGAVNPYLLQAALLVAGLKGIADKVDPGKRADWNGHFPHPSKSLPTLPENLLDALRLLDEATFLREALSDEFVDSYVMLRKKQWHSYLRHLSQWEIDNTLDC